MSDTKEVGPSWEGGLSFSLDEFTTAKSLEEIAAGFEAWAVEVRALAAMPGVEFSGARTPEGYSPELLSVDVRTKDEATAKEYEMDEVAEWD